MNIQKMLKQAQQMQAKLAEVQDKLADEEAEGSAGGGMVKIILNGKTEMKKITIDASLLNKDEKEMLEDLILAAFNDAKKKIDDNTSTQMRSITGGMQLPPGIKLPF
jgi:DNA-binding YbaB/EbfC family protein